MMFRKTEARRKINQNIFWLRNGEQIIQEFTLDGAVMQVGAEVISTKLLMSCQLHACYCTMIKLALVNLEGNVLSHYITPWKTM